MKEVTKSLACLIWQSTHTLAYIGIVKTFGKLDRALWLIDSFTHHNVWA